MTIEQQRFEWHLRLGTLVDSIDSWATDSGWSTRRIEKSMHDSLIGDSIAPALLMQRETCRVLLEPITHSALEADGVVDIYRMPAYDDIATLVFDRGGWAIRPADADSVIGNSVVEPLPLSKERFAAVLQDMIQHAAAP